MNIIHAQNVAVQNPNNDYANFAVPHYKKVTGLILGCPAFLCGLSSVLHRFPVGASVLTTMENMYNRKSTKATPPLKTILDLSGSLLLK